MKRILLVFTLFVNFTFFAQTLYNRSQIQTIEIFFSNPNWDAVLDAATSTDAYTICDSVRINGVVFDSVGVKYKGNSSYNANNAKNPLHLNLDYIKGSQDYEGYTSIKLSNCYNDPSMLREVLSYSVFEQFMDAPKSNYANVYINGALKGIYSNSQSIDDRFTGEHFYSTKAPFFKCNPIGGAGPGTTTNPDLKWINGDSTSYASRYELQSDYGWKQLVDLIDTLNNNSTKIESVLDVDRALWMLACNNVLVNLDSYNGATRQNYYLYFDINKRFVPISWDLNESFDAFPGGTGSGTYTASSLDPLSNSTSTNHPLLVKLLGNAMYKRMYLAHVRTIVKEVFESNAYLDTANKLRSLISTHVANDVNKFYTTSQFQSSLTTGVTGGGPGGHVIPGLQTLMAARVTYFNSNTNYNLVAPVISTVSADDQSPNYGQTVTITAQCSGESVVYIGYRYDRPLKFTRLQMFDDGLHGDGLANDHLYGIQLPINSATFEYYIYAENTNAGIFSPTRAEHEFHSLTVNITQATNGQIKLNELLADNAGLYFDLHGESDDWVELYNTTSQPLDVSNLYLSDDPLNFVKWKFPAGSVVPANGFLVVWTDNDPEQAGIHTNFKLSLAGEPLILSNGTTVFDEIDFPAQTSNQSYFRCSDGGATLLFGTPTFESNNACSASLAENLDAFELEVYPVPSAGDVTLTSSEVLQQVVVFDAFGKVVFQTSNCSSVMIPSQHWQAGIYVVSVVQNGLSKQAKLIKY